MATATIQVIEPERVSDEDAKKIPAGQVVQPLPAGPLEEKEVEGQAPYWMYYRCGCGAVFRVALDTDSTRYFHCACGRYLYRA
jgi:hypothetical protein